MTSILRTVLIGALAVTCISGAIGFGVKTAVERVVVRESIDKAEHWAAYMADRIPDLSALIATGIPTATQQDVINEIKEVGDIFRFKLFAADGRLSILSDYANVLDHSGIALEADPEPLQVATTGILIVDVFDGSERSDRPDLYAEAYVPLIGEDGSVEGVIEVYIDQTRTRMYFVDSFRNFGILLMVFCSLIFAVPGIAFYLQRRFAQKSRRDAEFLSRFDPLTGVLNRREFVMRAEELIENSDLSVICFLDLDRFKAINDTYGHAAGDAFLVHVSQVLRQNCRADDLLARFGGDEFVIAFQNVSCEDAVQRTRAILKQCAQEVCIHNIVVSGSVSVGVAELEVNDDLEKALSNADAALYHAKASGRNEFAIYGDEMGEDIRLRHALEARLRIAARTNDFEIFYQPLVDGVTCSVVGHEALLRLRDNDGSHIPPDVFIPLAEDLGLIEDIGRWTIMTATRDMALVDREKVLAINLSTVQFSSGELVATVRNALEQSGLPAKNLELEITESLLLDDGPSIGLQIDALKEMGVSIAMDDFGTGFSSLSYLWKYGFDRLKIDRSFIAALDKDPERSREIIETIIMLGARLGMKITAEGVETSEQSQLLSSLGCDIMQGYLFGKASPLEKAEPDVGRSAQSA